MYRKACNTCRCGLDNNLMCTKMGCLNKDEWTRVEQTVKKQKQMEKDAEKIENKRVKEADKTEMKKARNTVKLSVARWLPDLPVGKCAPGKLYQKNCRGCFCNYNKEAVCVKQPNACDEGFYPDSADAVRPPYSQAEFEKLPELPHMAAKCVPGKSYKVNCNSCVCLINHSLMCDLTMCLSYEDIHVNMAGRSSNKNCTAGQQIQSPEECIDCVCTRKGKTKCTAIEGCLTAEEQRRNLHEENEKKKPKMALQFDHKGKCAPGTIYRLHCNRCFCQEDGSMRCTQKTCLHYAQTLQIQKHRLFLEKHGL